MAASNQLGGVRVFSNTSFEALEEAMNEFLRGNGTIESPKKVITQAPSIFLSGTTFYCMIIYVNVFVDIIGAKTT